MILPAVTTIPSSGCRAGVLSVKDFFQPDNAAYLAVNDADLGSGSPVLMPDNSSSTPHEVIGGGKGGNIFVVNRGNMGSFSPTSNNVIQTVQPAFTGSTTSSRLLPIRTVWFTSTARAMCCEPSARAMVNSPPSP
jgi:hypothetical protein